MNNEKEFFLPGNVVTVKQNIPYKPIMIVVKKVVKTIKIQNERNDFFQGILCRWFTSEGLLQEAVWNTKDLKKISNQNKNF